MAQRRASFRPDNRNRTWLSKMAKSAYVTTVVQDEVVKAKRLAETKVSSSQGRRLDWNYGMTKLKGPWGYTHLVWPTSPMARKYPHFIRDAINITRFHRKGGR